MALSDAERQRRARERRKQESAAQERREEVRKILANGSACRCCDEGWMEFLVMLDGEVYCRNCAHIAASGGLCIHRGVSRRLG